jgi:hypothetical protein
LDPTFYQILKVKIVGLIDLLFIHLDIISSKIAVILKKEWITLNYLRKEVWKKVTLEHPWNF